ncbi:MAG: Toluene-4-monooxygenase system protein D [Dehalococcoidia bacterium]|nr:Toluene-4-monooxygenase system protein D [Chloroflexota bacterium]
MKNSEVKLVGPVIRGFDQEMIDAVIDAAEQDNPGREIIVEDYGGYVRIHADREFCLTEKSMVQMLGRPFHLTEMEPNLVSFSGRLSSGKKDWVWTLND